MSGEVDLVLAPKGRPALKGEVMITLHCTVVLCCIPACNAKCNEMHNEKVVGPQGRGNDNSALHSSVVLSFITL